MLRKPEKRAKTNPKAKEKIKEKDEEGEDGGPFAQYTAVAGPALNRPHLRSVFPCPQTRLRGDQLRMTNQKVCIVINYIYTTGWSTKGGHHFKDS